MLCLYPKHTCCLLFSFLQNTVGSFAEYCGERIGFISAVQKSDRVRRISKGRCISIVCVWLSIFPHRLLSEIVAISLQSSLRGILYYLKFKTIDIFPEYWKGIPEIYVYFMTIFCIKISHSSTPCTKCNILWCDLTWYVVYVAPFRYLFFANFIHFPVIVIQFNNHTLLAKDLKTKLRQSASEMDICLSLREHRLGCFCIPLFQWDTMISVGVCGQLGKTMHACVCAVVLVRGEVRESPFCLSTINNFWSLCGADVDSHLNFLSHKGFLNDMG